MKLTTLEIKVLKGLYESSQGNGHDFGCTGDHMVKACVTSPRQLSGVMSSLSKKQVVEVFESFQCDGTTNFKFINLGQVEAALNLPLTKES